MRYTPLLKVWLIKSSRTSLPHENWDFGISRKLIFSLHQSEIWAQIMSHLHVMNKKLANFHKMCKGLTPSETVIYTAWQLAWKPWQRFHSKFGIRQLQGHQCKVENTPWKNLNVSNSHDKSYTSGSYKKVLGVWRLVAVPYCAEEFSQTVGMRKLIIYKYVKNLCIEFSKIVT